MSHYQGGVVKGGLRLSYSKNSLGQRSNNQPSRINTGSGMSDITSPGSFATGQSSLSPTSSTNGISFHPHYGRTESQDSGLASSFKSETPLSPHAVPFNSSSLPATHDGLPNMTSPRLQRFPSTGSEGRQTKDGSLLSISPRAAFSSPWPMTSINPLTSPHGGGNNASMPPVPAPQHASSEVSRST